MLTGTPMRLKQANLALVRRVLMERESVTRGEIAKAIGVSSTTVRALLGELLEVGEIESVGYDASSGGRKAERYRYRPERYHAAVFCMTDDAVHYLLVNARGEIVEKDALAVQDGDMEGAVFTCMDGLTARLELRAVGLGVPGVVEGERYWKKWVDSEAMCQMDLGERLKTRYGLPVMMENDLKATAIGFGRCYEASYPDERSEDTNMAYLSFVDGCVSAGFLSGGKVVRGHANFAGEISLVPTMGGETREGCFLPDVDDKTYTNHVVGILAWICGILNPQYIALGGSDLRERCIGAIGDALFALLPRNMCAEILHAPDVWNDYHMGMAHLTAGKMFDEIQLVKE